MMKKKLKCIMLVDDDNNDNFFHKREIIKVNPAISVMEKNNGQEALEYLKSNNIKPDLIFLDINMPIMDGWVFLTECSRLDKEFLNSLIIIMLTSSENPTDELRARAWGFVSGYLNKPLTKEILENIIKNYFEE